MLYTKDYCSNLQFMAYFDISHPKNNFKRVYAHK